MRREKFVEQPGRDDLISWKESQPANYFTAGPPLRSLLELRMGKPLPALLVEKLTSFGRDVAQVIEPAVQTQERNREFPKLRSFDEVGSHVEQVEFHPAHEEAARAASS